MRYLKKSKTFWINNVSIMKQIVWENQELHKNFSRPSGYHGFDQSNILHIFISNSRTPSVLKCYNSIFEFLGQLACLGTYPLKRKVSVPPIHQIYDEITCTIQQCMVRFILSFTWWICGDGMNWEETCYFWHFHTVELGWFENFKVALF